MSLLVNLQTVFERVRYFCNKDGDNVLVRFLRFVYQYGFSCISGEMHCSLKPLNMLQWVTYQQILCSRADIDHWFWWYKTILLYASWLRLQVGTREADQTINNQAVIELLLIHTPNCLVLHEAPIISPKMWIEMSKFSSPITRWTSIRPFR